MTLTFDEFEACKRVIKLAEAEGNPYIEHIFNVNRWIQAYEGNEEEAAKILKRHLNLRKVMGWDDWPEESEGFDERVDQFAPLSILGQNKDDDNKVVLFEQSGKIDIHGLIDNAKVTSFMRAKFRLMERIHRKVIELEKKTGRQSGGLLVMDLDGLEFRPALLSLLAGPYRIMWGTLFEQYPQLIRHILIVRAPKFVNLLYSTCIPFIPNDYRSRLEICSSSDPSNTLLKHISASLLPKEYCQGGNADDEDNFEMITIPIPLSPFPPCIDSPVDLDTISVSAGDKLIKKYHWEAGTKLHFYMKHSEGFHFFIYYSKDDIENEDLWQEIYAGSERPPLRLCDDWKWETPKSGYYYLCFGNERAWFFSVTLQYRVFRLIGEHRQVEEAIE
ncbi:unnamed protein product, partial [Mesorhabditis belari]|uniref:CRAL-TRIO domain-containing protein n=1 Tax=Mesorhabditis belari TaxID=2138241 RepID=A0AAF3F1K6_9BILA